MEQFKVGDIVKPNSKANWGPNWAKAEGIIEAVVRTASPYTYSVEVTKTNERGKQYMNQVILCQQGYEAFELVKSVDTELHITGDGKTTHAVLKKDGKIVKRARADCDPRDEFDFETGARYAIDRVFGKEEEKKEPKYKFNIGDRVLVTKRGFARVCNVGFMEQFGKDFVGRYAYGIFPNEGGLYTVVQRKVPTREEKAIYVITPYLWITKGPLYLISGDGLEKA